MSCFLCLICTSDCSSSLVCDRSDALHCCIHCSIYSKHCSTAPSRLIEDIEPQIVGDGKWKCTLAFILTKVCQCPNQKNFGKTGGCGHPSSWLHGIVFIPCIQLSLWNCYSWSPDGLRQYGPFGQPKQEGLLSLQSKWQVERRAHWGELLLRFCLERMMEEAVHTYNKECCRHNNLHTSLLILVELSQTPLTSASAWMKEDTFSLEFLFHCVKFL